MPDHSALNVLTQTGSYLQSQAPNNQRRKRITFCSIPLHTLLNLRHKRKNINKTILSRKKKRIDISEQQSKQQVAKHNSRTPQLQKLKLQT